MSCLVAMENYVVMLCVLKKQEGKMPSKGVGSEAVCDSLAHVGVESPKYDCGVILGTRWSRFGFKINLRAGLSSNS